MLDVLMLTNNDWANTGFRFSQCLESLGLNVLLLKGHRHTFGYPVQGEVHRDLTVSKGVFGPGKSSRHIQELMEEAHVVHFIASSYINPGIDMRKKNVVMQHGGSAYRAAHELLNPVYNQFTDVTIIQMPDLLGHGAKNEVWISFPVDTKALQPGKIRMEGPLRIGHFPSVASVKGTDVILRVIESLREDSRCQEQFRDRFEYIGVSDLFPHLTKWVANLKRLSQCDIYVEACKLQLDGRQYGEWGNTVVEAAALGKVVVTNSLGIKWYEEEYGKCPLLIANSEAELKDTLRELVMADRMWLVEKAGETREWVVKYHSMEATARKLKEKVYSRFFDF